MDDKKYYNERINKMEREKYEFNELKRYFLNLFKRLEKECYFQEFFGYTCTDGDVVGKLGEDIEAEIFLKTGIKKAWPLSEYIEFFDDSVFFTIIEFLFDHISEPKNKFYHEWKQCGYHATSFNTNKGHEKFILEMNKLFEGYKEELYITKNGQVSYTAGKGFEELIEKEELTGESESVDSRISYAISTYFRFSSGEKEKKDAVRTLSDVLEYYKKQGLKLDNKDDSDLFQIINGFDIRHHNKEQVSTYNKELWYEWMLYTFLASIRVIQKFNGLV
jgi:hypothetical protein